MLFYIILFISIKLDEYKKLNVYVFFEMNDL